MRPETDLSAVMDGLYMMRTVASPAKAYSVFQAIRIIRRAGCFPEAYVDGLQDEMLQMLGQPPPREAIASVYLAFHGLGDRSQFLKVGLASDVKKRMRELYTGNPMPRMWTFASEFTSRSLAYRVERGLHEHLKDSATSGEWFQAQLSQEAADMFAQSLSEVATMIADQPVAFAKLGI